MTTGELRAQSGKQLRPISNKTGNMFRKKTLTYRECKVEIYNKSSTYTLCEPCCFLVSGHCMEPLPPTLQPTETGRALFIKTPYSVCGSEGVFTYSILKKSSSQKLAKLAVMFSNPYNFAAYDNRYAVGKVDLDKVCNKDLFKEMYDNNQTDFVCGNAKGPGLTQESNDVTISATMSDSYQPVLKVEICDT